MGLSKTFNKVWQDGLIYELKRLGISWKYHRFLNDIHQRVVLNGQSLNWSKIKAGFLQDSILGLLFFLVYITDLPGSWNTSAKFFADDTLLFSVVHDSMSSSVLLNDDLLNISQ